MKNTRRIIALCLAIVLMLSMAITASAASVSWTEGSYTYEAIVTEGTSHTRYAQMTSIATQEHLPSGNQFTVTPSDSIYYFAADFYATYSNYLTQALNKTTNLRSYRVVKPSVTQNYKLASSASPGTYGVYAVITCKTAPWRVDRNSIDTVDSGTLSYAPTATWDFTIMKV